MFDVLSQGHFNCLATCPRKFQHIYRDRLIAPTTLEEQQRMTYGTLFHRLMQQCELKLPVNAFIKNYEKLGQGIIALKQIAPTVFPFEEENLPENLLENLPCSIPDDIQKVENTYRESEHPRSFNLEGYSLTVVYDLLVATPDRATIFDWKTYPRPKRSIWLSQNWQTRLYRYVLTETSPYEPEQISMVYWFIQAWNDRGEIRPQSLEFTYDRAQHEQTHQDLVALLKNLTEWNNCYQGDANQNKQSFPQVEITKQICNDCPFAKRCGREISPLERNASHANNGEFRWQDLQEIPEVSV